MKDFKIKGDHEIIKGIGGKTGEAMWKEIDDLVVRWTQRNPFGANWNRIYNQHLRDQADNKYAEWQDEGGRGLGTRNTIAVHPELMVFIETFYPKLFESNANIRKFAKRYPMFKVADKI